MFEHSPSSFRRTQNIRVTDDKGQEIPFDVLSPIDKQFANGPRFARRVPHNTVIAESWQDRLRKINAQIKNDRDRGGRFVKNSLGFAAVYVALALSVTSVPRIQAAIEEIRPCWSEPVRNWDDVDVVIYDLSPKGDTVIDMPSRYDRSTGKQVLIQFPDELARAEALTPYSIYISAGYAPQLAYLRNADLSNQQKAGILASRFTDQAKYRDPNTRQHRCSEETGKALITAPPTH